MPLAQALKFPQRLGGKAAIYKALRCWAQLREIAATGVGLFPPGSHEATIRSRHARKTMFWTCMNGKRSARADGDEHGSDAQQIGDRKRLSTAARSAPLTQDSRGGG